MSSFSNILRQLPIRDLFSEPTIRDSRRASRLYDREDSPRYPALQHQFFVKFSINTGISYTYVPEVGLNIRSFDRPSVNFDTHELNQYNKKRMVQTGLHYNSINAMFYDTNDRIMQQLFIDYCRWYYGDFAVEKSPTSWTSDITTAFMTDERGWGFSPISSLGPNEGYFFDHIDLYDVSPSGNSTVYRLIHPIVESWTLGNDNYESSEKKEISMTFKYEGINFLASDGPASGANELDSNFFLKELSDYAELPSPGRAFLTDAISVGRDIVGGNAGNIATRFGLPGASVLQGIQSGQFNPIAVGADAVRVVKGASALASFGSFSFGSSSTATTTPAVSPAAGAEGARREFIANRLARSVVNVETGSTEDAAYEDSNTDKTLAVTYNPTVNTSQQESSEEGKVSTTLSTAIAGTSPGKVNASGTKLEKNYVNTTLAAGRPAFQSGVSTNDYQSAQGLVQTGKKVPDAFRDSVASALVTASKRTGKSISELAKSHAAESATTERNLSLTNQALSEINRLKSASAQYGVKNNSLVNSLDPDARRILAAKG